MPTLADLDGTSMGVWHHIRVVLCPELQLGGTQVRDDLLHVNRKLSASRVACRLCQKSNDRTPSENC
jgi:hypothetical protein